MLVGLNADCFPRKRPRRRRRLTSWRPCSIPQAATAPARSCKTAHARPPLVHRRGQGRGGPPAGLETTGANMVIFDNDLTPSQTRTLEDILKTHRARPQRAHPRYFRPAGQDALRASCRSSWRSISIYCPGSPSGTRRWRRLGGGIGTRGPGETQLETDKRYIRSRIQKLRENLELRAQDPRRAAAADGRKTSCPSWRSSATRTQANRRC